MKWTESVGVTLVARDLTSMEIEAPNGHLMKYEILQLFPFTSETKRMGIIVRVSLISWLANQCYKVTQPFETKLHENHMPNVASIMTITCQMLPVS